MGYRQSAIRFPDSPRKKEKMLKRVLFAGAVVATFGAITASAQAMTLSLGAPQLSAKVLISEPVTVTCSPFDPSLILTSQDINLQVEQASGQGIAYGTATAFGFSPMVLFPCDNNSHTLVFNVLANTAGQPFHGGPAAFTATAGANAATPCFPGSTTCFMSPSMFQSASEDATLNLH
ncbi:MAG TPA: hypothetical protein VGH56_05370 [Solirubrobacteraceae bacterium]